MRFIQPRNYFWKILTTIGVVSIGFQLFTLSTLAYFMVVPLGHRAAEDLASIITHAAETWVLLSPDEREKFEQRIRRKHQLLIVNGEQEIPPSTIWLPYLHFLETSLARESGQDIHVMQSYDDAGQAWFWVDIAVDENIIRFGFADSRLGVNPPTAFFLILSIGLFLTVVTAIMLTRRLTAQVERLYHAAQNVGKGHWPDPVIEDGPQELVVLTREFNRMNVQVRELLSNRTTLLAGIAHDLRTPLTQIQLALSLLPQQDENRSLINSIDEDLKLINRLIDETMSISLELEEEKNEATDIVQVLEKLRQTTLSEDVDIRWHFEGRACGKVMHPMALRRILTNLLGNALRYGQGLPVDIYCQREGVQVLIEILDRGSGIPESHREAVFRPFFRLEKSRGSQTGGSGLGLAIVRQLADANQWKVCLLPRQGGGTRAQIIFPVFKPE